MKPGDVLAAIDADIAESTRQLEIKVSVRRQLVELYGPPPASSRVTRKAKRGKAVNGHKPRGRRQPLAPGSLGDRIVSVLTEFGAPMARAALVEKVKARLPDVIAELGDFVPLPTGGELCNYWMARLTGGERACLEILVAQFPKSVDREYLTDKTGYKRSSRDTYLQRLMARRLVTAAGRGEVRASEELFT